MKFKIRILSLVCVLLATIATEATCVELLQLNEDNYADIAPQGKEVDWIYGDFVLRNSRTLAVIAQPRPERNANMTVRGVAGCLIDLTSRDEPNDQLSAYFPAGGYFVFEGGKKVAKSMPPVLPYRSTQPREHLGLIFLGKPNPRVQDVEQLEGLECELTYWLCDDVPVIGIDTRIVNTGDETRRLKLFDVVRADRDFESGADPSLNLFHTADYWWRQAYGTVAMQRKITLEQQARNLAVHFQDDQQNDQVELAPQASVQWSRYLLHAPDSLGIRAIACQLQGTATHPVSFQIADADGVVAGAKVTIKEGNVELGKLSSDKRGIARVELPSGSYTALVEGLGRAEKSHPFEVSSAASTQAISLPTTGYIHVRVRDENDQPIACKVAFEAASRDDNPFFGPDTFVWEVHNLIYSEDGSFRHAVPPGNYNLLISHGPEYDAVIRPILLKAGKANELYVEATLRRTVDSRGWISADFHSHSSPSGDNTCSQLGRVLNLLAEHIEFAPCTEHNRISTYVPHLQRLGAVDRMATCSGIELTGNVLPVNHQNAFPLVEFPNQQDGGAPQTSDDPVEQIERLRNWDDQRDKVVQENHPNIPRILCDANEDGVADEGFRGMFPFMDLIEVHPPALILSPPEPSTSENPFGNPSVHWLQLLNLGYRIYGAVNTDAHFTFHGSGFLRNFVRCDTDNPREITVENMIKSCHRGNIVMSNGPFLEVIASTNQNQTAHPGEDLTVQDGKVRLFVKVQCANWLDVNRVQVLLNGRADKKLDLRRREHQARFRNGVTKFEETLDLELTQDTHVIVVAIGEGLALGPVVGPDHASDTPVAVSNPIFVDVDGNGFQPNGDLLDIPLPAGPEQLHKLMHPHEHPDSPDHVHGHAASSSNEHHGPSE